MRRIADRAGRAAVTMIMASAVLSACSGSDGTASAAPPTATPSAPAETGTTSSATPSPVTTSPGLESYTDPGDGCAQAISAIGYTEESLLVLGQEPYQTFDDVVRSKLAEVAGTLSLEAKDWPNKAVYRQAQKVIPLAEQAGHPAPAHDKTRIRVLLEYRVEAAKLVQLCRYPTS
jgi:hypothetical protein